MCEEVRKSLGRVSRCLGASARLATLSRTSLMRGAWSCCSSCEAGSACIPSPSKLSTLMPSSGHSIATSTCRARTHTVQSPECCSAERRMRWDLSVLWRVGSGRDEAGRGVEPPVELGGGGRDLRKARGGKAGDGERR